MLRELCLKREKNKKRMTALWNAKESRDWSAEERKEYDELATKTESLNKDISLRSQFEKDFKLSKGKEDKDFERSQHKASIFNVIRSLIYRQTGDSSYKDDYGRVDECLQEHNRSVDKSIIKDGFASIPESCFQTQKRTDITSSTQGGDSLISEKVMPSLYVEGLYEKTWLDALGVPMVSGLQGNVKIPAIKDKPSFSWIAENANFPEQDQTFQDIEFTPLYAGAIQVLSLGIFLRSESQSVMRFVQEELMRSFRAGIEKSFIQDDGTSNKPKGLYEIVNDYSSGANEVVAKTNGGAITYAKCLEAEGKITATNQPGPLSWLISDKVRLLAQQVLKFAVNGSKQLYQPEDKMLADRSTAVTNGIQDNVTEGSSTNNTSKIVIFQPQSLVVGRWLGGIQLQVNTQGAEYWKAGKTAVRVIDVCTLKSRRDSDFAVLKGIK